MKPVLEKFKSQLDKLALKQAPNFPYNIFSIIGFGGQEIKHSNFMSWIFDHANPHDLGNLVLKEFLLRSIAANEEDNASIDPEILDNYKSLVEDSNNLLSYEVRREWHHIDLLVVNQDQKLLILFENKVWSPEIIEDGRSQLDAYLDKVDTLFPGYKVICIYLTPTKELPHFKRHQRKFIKANYYTLYKILDEIKGYVKKSDILLIINSYLDLLKRNDMITEKNIEKAVDKMWQEETYQHILKAIVKQQPTVHANLLRLVKMHIQENYNQLILTDCDPGGTRFVTKGLQDISGDHLQTWKFPKSKTGLYFYIGEVNNKKGNGLYLCSVLANSFVNPDLKRRVYEKFNHKKMKDGKLLQYPHLANDLELLSDQYFVEYHESENKELLFEEMKEIMLQNLDAILKDSTSQIYEIEGYFLVTHKILDAEEE